MLLGASFVGIIGHLGLVLIKGQGTDKALPPGLCLRCADTRSQIFPSVELTYRAGGTTRDDPN